MSALTRRQLAARAGSRPTRTPADCPHTGRRWYAPLDPDRVIKTCAGCGAPLDAPQPRCTARLATRRCLAPARDGDRCMAHAA